MMMMIYKNANIVMMVMIILMIMMIMMYYDRVLFQMGTYRILSTVILKRIPLMHLDLINEAQLTEMSTLFGRAESYLTPSRPV